ncbi:hypothetical protein [Nonomuraea sp. SYSU D8015]|uniref:hypothetical protein n=1 Tax=Nonomuraea sp. SYSU D8015 TaxID=2593644 RepID=UPI001660558E|nr:hypothetical protein [Nonomuraea sp. SYSU D8015]
MRRAHRLLLASCMQRFGFRWNAPEPQPSTFIPRLYRRFLYTPPDQAAEYGYHRPDHLKDEPANDNGQGAKPSPDQQLVLSGRGASSLRGTPIPEGGCYGEADRKLATGAPHAPDDVIARLHLESTRRAEADSRFKAVTTRWSACMRGQGYDYRSPSHANDDPRWWSGKTATPDEIEVSLADVRCKQQVNYLGVAAAVTAAYQQRLIEDNAEVVRAYRKALDVQVRNAARVLSGALF